MGNAVVMDRAAFFDWAESQPTGRYERIGGEVVRMSPERVEHVALKGQIWLALYQALRGQRGFHVYADGMTVSVDDETDYEPDVSVNAGPKLAKGVRALPSPVIVAEVLSPSSRRIDTTVKREKYLQVPSLQHYLIFRTDRREVTHWRRAASAETRSGGELHLDPPGIVVNIDEIYALADEQ